LGSPVTHLVARALALSIVACGNPASVAIPHGRPTLELVRCTAAVPRPLASGEAADISVDDRPSGGRVAVRLSTESMAGKHPTVSLGTPVAVGPLAIAEVTTKLRAQIGHLTACYVNARGVPSRAAVQYRLVVAGDGTVAYATSSSAALASPLDTCIRGVLRSIRYLATGRPTTVNVPLVFDATGAFATKPVDPESAGPPEPWTPFAIGTLAGGAAAAGAARVTEAALRPRIANLDHCFDKSASTGSMRMLLEIDLAGDLQSVRVGGLGDRDSETCTAKALSDLHVMTPLQEHVEVACDLSRGDAQPWRLTPSAGYDVIDVERLQLRHGTETVVPGSSDPAPLPADTYVVIARPDTPGGLLQLALMWARDASAILLAVADGRPAPLFLGMGNASSAATDSDDSEVLRPAVRIGRKEANGCVGRASSKANVTDPGELDVLLGKLAARCHQVRCSPTLVVAIDSDAMTRDLLDVAGAARRAGFDRVLFGGSELGCTVEAKKPDPESDDGDERDYE